MIERIAKEALLRLASQFPVVGVTGPRQSGKSTLTKATFPHKRYVTFDDRTMRSLAASNPQDFIAAFPEGAIIDEAQKVPEIFDAIKYSVDNTQTAPGKFIVTGSSQFRLRENMTDSMARDVGVSAPTIKTWLSILETSFIIHFLEPDTNNLGKNIVKTPKLYFADSGLLCHMLRLETKEELLLSRYKGAVAETFAITELLKQRLNQGKKANLTFFRDDRGFEVDTIADWKHTYAIEIKSANAPEHKLAANTKKYLALRQDENARNAIFYLGDMSMNINGTSYVSWKDWGDL